MKRTFGVLAAAILALVMAACSCGVEKKALDDLKTAHDLIFPEYVRFVEAANYDADPEKNKAAKERRKAVVQKANEVVDALRKAAD